MNKFLLAFLVLVLPFNAMSAEDSAEDTVVKREEFITIGQMQIKNPERTKEEDASLTFSNDLRPVEKQMTEDEKLAEGDSESLQKMHNPSVLPEISCELPGLKKQVENFIYDSLGSDNSNSIIERRQRILTVRNLNNFHEVDEKSIDSKENFETASAITYLKINENREIAHICQSSGNTRNKDLKDVFVIIYPYTSYYKVIVANLIKSTEELNKATFIYNW